VFFDEFFVKFPDSVTGLYLQRSDDNGSERIATAELSFLPVSHCPGAFYLVPWSLEGAANRIVEDVGNSLYRNPTSRGQ
jgi:hypothetical protein